jgi:hypothetical protein
MDPLPPTQRHARPIPGLIRYGFPLASNDQDGHTSGGARALHCCRNVARFGCGCAGRYAIVCLPPGKPGKADFCYRVNLGRVIELEAGGPIPGPQGEAAGVNAPAAAADHPEHRLLRHWMPWLIPLLAIALPLLYFIVAASIPEAAWRWGEASTSLGRGDFLIPVLILCLEAIRHWWSEVKCGWKMGIVRVISSALCLGAVVVCLDSFSVAASHAVTADSTKSVAVITWGCFAVGFLSGTIAVWVSGPKEGRS